MTAVTRRIGPVRRLLMDAKALIKKPENWCKRRNARSVTNKPSYTTSPLACKFCAYSAVYRAYFNKGCPSPDERSVHETRSLIRDVLDGSLIEFNDAPETTHPMIMRLFNKAIKRAKEQGV